MSSSEMPESLTGKERFFDESEVIVSKTDLKGHLTYANEVFLKISDFTEPELIGTAHSILRHPDMPRCVFKLLWDTIAAGQEIFAFVINKSKFGDHYWVLAHVTPTFDSAGKIIGYHSNRRVPNKRVINDTIIPLYRALLAEENRHANRKDGMIAGTKMIHELLAQKGVGYDELIFSLLQN